MTTNLKGALDEIFAVINTAINSNSVNIFGYLTQVQWPGMNTGVMPDNSKFLTVISSQPVKTIQSTFSENVVQLGSRRFENNGLIFVQLCCPVLTNGESLTLAFGQAILSALRKSTNNVILRNARILNLPDVNGAVRKNIVVEYQFDEID